ncbi:hypothetical protein [Paenibacillus sp. 1A_MP2]|uniref:hypothetical protein n=1 Tax=Paenibacillus sp. 1A_MP2 TaxID=3457495 RepID=UPI003FCEDCC2
MNKTPSLAPPEVMDFCANPECASEIVDGQIAVRHGKDLYCKLSCMAKSIGAVTMTAGEEGRIDEDSRTLEKGQVLAKPALLVRK